MMVRSIFPIGGIGQYIWVNLFHTLIRERKSLESGLIGSLERYLAIPNGLEILRVGI